MKSSIWLGNIAAVVAIVVFTVVVAQPAIALLFGDENEEFVLKKISAEPHVAVGQPLHEIMIIRVEMNSLEHAKPALLGNLLRVAESGFKRCLLHQNW